jgi:hypothetical protein
MGVLGAADIWRMFEWANKALVDQHRIRRDRVDQWLDAVLVELENLSDAWTTMADAAATDSDLQKASRWLSPVYANSRAITALWEFYRSASSVIGGDSPFQEKFLRRLATVLQAREKALLKLAAAQSPITMDGAEALQYMRNDAAALQEQVATLKASIISFKAQPDRR